MKTSEQIGTHFTASTAIIHKGKLLLLKQAKRNFWVLPGGHIEENELPHEAAVREAFEETGLRIELLQKADEKAKTKLATPLPVPYTIRLLDCRDKKDIDSMFTAKMLSGKLKINEESLEAKWFSREEIENNPEIGPHLKYYALKILQNNAIEKKNNNSD